MAVLLTILKVTGIVILALIALVLLILIIVLFVPIRYRIKAEKGVREDDMYAKVAVTFLLHIISAGFEYDDGTDYYVKIFGIRVYPKKHKDEGLDDHETSDVPAETEVSSSADIEESPATVSNEDAFEATGYEEVSDEYLSDIFSIADTQQPEAEECEQDEDLWDKFEKLIDRICQKFRSLAEKYERSKKNLEFWKRMYNDKRNQRAFEHIKTVVLKVLKKIAPKSVKGFVRFGTDDPAITGGILAFLGILYPMLPRKLVIEPDFEEILLYGNVDIKGHIALIVLGVALLKLYFNKDCRRMWTIYKKHKANGNI